MMNPAHQRGQASISSVRSFDESDEHATDYISGMYQDRSSEYRQQKPLLNHHNSNTPTSPPKMGAPSQPTPSQRRNKSSSSSSSIQSTPSGSMYQQSLLFDSSPSSLERKSPNHMRPRIRPPSPPLLSAQFPLSGLDSNDDGSSPTSPAEIAKELSNLQAFKRLSLDASSQGSDPDLPSNRLSIPDFSQLMEAGVDEDAARLLWVPAHIHPEISANDEWKDFVQRRVEETKNTGTIGRVKSINEGPSGGRLSRSKSILSRQIDASDEDSWSSYSDAGHKELERRTSRNGGPPSERHNITVSELEKLEALIKQGALERQGRPVSGEGIEPPENAVPLSAGVPPTEDVPPLMPIKGTLRRSAHTSMRNARRGAAARSARRSSEPKKVNSRISQGSITEEEDVTKLVESTVATPSSQVLERSGSLPALNGNLTRESRERATSLDADKSRTSAPAILEQLDLQNLGGASSDAIQSPEPLFENEELLLGQVQPRQLRRPPIRRQAMEAPESLPLPPPVSPTKEQDSEKPQKKSPVSPSFPPRTPSPRIPDEQTVQSPPQQYKSTQSPPSQAHYQQPVPPPPDPPAPTTQLKKGWSRLFSSSSDDDQAKEKHPRKPKKATSYAEIPKNDGRPEKESIVDLERGKPLDDSTPAINITPAPPVQATPPPSSQKQSNKKESGLFASLFGSKKKSESKEKQSKNQESSKSNGPDRSQYQRHGPGGWADQGNALMGPPVFNFYYARFPIHVERAIYRLSHIKLANPRRPLVQQVLLSNFMYGYLNLINKTAQPQQPPEPQEIPQQAPQEMYEEQAQPEEHVFYSTDDQNEYYNQDYYDEEYEDGQDQSISQSHEMDYGYSDTGYQAPMLEQSQVTAHNAQNPSYNQALQHTYDHQSNGRHIEPQDSEDLSGGNTYVLRDSRGRTLSLPKSNMPLSSGNTWASGGNPPQARDRYE